MSSTDTATPFDYARVGKVFKHILKVAGLPAITARTACGTRSLLLQRGESPAYVQRQLGHAVSS